MSMGGVSPPCRFSPRGDYRGVWQTRSDLTNLKREAKGHDKKVRFISLAVKLLLEAVFGLQRVMMRRLQKRGRGQDLAQWQAVYTGLCDVTRALMVVQWHASAGTNRARGFLGVVSAG